MNLEEEKALTDPEVQRVIKTHQFLNNKEQEMNHKKVLDEVKSKCIQEIKWVEDCLEDIKSGTEYHEEDKTTLPTHKEAHENILEIINRSKSSVEGSDLNAEVVALGFEKLLDFISEFDINSGNTAIADEQNTWRQGQVDTMDAIIGKINELIKGKPSAKEW